MNPYATVAVMQHNKDLVLLARSVNAKGVDGLADANPDNGILARLRKSLAPAWSMTSTTQPTTPQLRDYPFTA